MWHRALRRLRPPRRGRTQTKRLSAVVSRLGALCPRRAARAGPWGSATLKLMKQLTERLRAGAIGHPQDGELEHGPRVAGSADLRGGVQRNTKPAPTMNRVEQSG